MMPRKTTLLIIILAVVTGLLTFFAVMNQGQPTPTKTPTPTQVVAPSIAPFATLSFSTPQIDLSGPSAAPTQTVDVVLDSMTKPVSGVQVEISYNPAVFTSVSLAAPKVSLFGANAMVLINTVDPKQGRISYATAISPTAKEVAGKGTVLSLTFTANKYAGVPIAQITILPKSMITTLESTTSVLKESSPLNVILSNSSPSPTK